MTDERYYIIRGTRSGVFFGQIERRDEKEVALKNVRKLWYWSGANSMEDLALYGVKSPEKCKFTVVVPEMIIYANDISQIIPCTDLAARILAEVPEWRL